MNIENNENTTEKVGPDSGDIREWREDLNLNELKGFIGTEKYYNFFGINITDGVKYIVNNGYGWFVTDTVYTILKNKKIKKYLQYNDFLSIMLNLSKDNTANITITDGNDHRLFYRHYDYTDAKVEIELFYFDGVLMLASEF